MTQKDDSNHLRRWRLILGGGEADGICPDVEGSEVELSDSDLAVDGALQALYDGGQGGLGRTVPNVARWLGDIRTYFPTSMVRVLQRDALERLSLHTMLLEPEMLEVLEPDVRLVADLLSLRSVMPHKTKDTARQVVGRVVEELQRQWANLTREALMGSLKRTTRNRRPRHHEIDWQRTIRANLKHYQPEYRTIIPQTRIGFGRKGSALRDIILCIDQSASMATSVVYASIFGAVLASLGALKTTLVVFDTSVVDLSDRLQDPVEVLFGIQLGGGTDIHQAIAYCQGVIQRPQETIFVLISDLYEGGNPDRMQSRMGALVKAGVQVVVLLALNDEGKPDFDRRNAEKLAALGIPALACTPDRFPDLMAAAIEGKDLGQWVAKSDRVNPHNHP